MKELNICITVDTENPQTPLYSKKFKDNRMLSDGWGIQKICEMLKSEGVRASFFLNVYEYVVWGRSEIQRIARYIHDSGHDVELHTHPVWIDPLRRENMFQFSLGEQKAIIHWGANFIREATGRWPRCHRAGAYGYNKDTLIALADCGIEADSSHFLGHRYSRHIITQNKTVQSHGVIELPITVVQKAHYEIQKVDLDAMSPKEIAEIAQSMINESKNDYMNIMFHSYSMTQTQDGFKTYAPFPEKVERLEKCIKMIKSIPGVVPCSLSMYLDRVKKQSNKQFSTKNIHHKIKKQSQSLTGNVFVDLAKYGLALNDIYPERVAHLRDDVIISKDRYRRQKIDVDKKYEIFIQKHQYLFDKTIGKGRTIGFIWYCTGTPPEVRANIILGKIFQEMGFRVVWIVCTGSPMYCFSNQYVNFSKVHCRACSRQMREMLSMYGQDIIELEKCDFPEFDQFDDLNVNEIINFHYKGHDAGRAAFNSSLKFTKNDFCIGNEEMQYIVNALKGYIRTYNIVKNTIMKKDIDIILTEGGQYVNNRATIHAAKDLKKDFITYENFGPKRIMLAKNASCFAAPVDQTPISETEERMIESGKRMIDDITTGRYYNYNFNPSENVAGIQFDDYILVLPNITWDSAAWYFDSCIYKNQYMWIFDTMDYCIKNKIKFVVRCHPGEKIMDSKYRLDQILRTYISQKYENMRSLDGIGIIYTHEDEISTYDLVKKANKAIVYVSTFGTESAHLNLPCINVGRPYYMGHGFNYFPESREEYIDLLQQKLSVSEAEKFNLYKYMAKLSNYRIRYNYGEFYKYTGIDQLNFRRISSENTYGVFPFDDMDLCKILGFLDKNFRL